MKNVSVTSSKQEKKRARKVYIYTRGNEQDSWTVGVLLQSAFVVYVRYVFYR